MNTDAEKKSQNQDKAAPSDIFVTQKPLAQGNSYLFEVVQKPPAQSTPNLFEPKVNTDAEKKPQNEDKAAPGDIFSTQKPLALFGVIQKPPAQGTLNLLGPKVNTDIEKKNQNEDKAAPGDIFATQKPLAQGNSYLFGAIPKPPAQGTPNLLGPKVNTDAEKKPQNEDKAAPDDIFSTQKPLALFGVIQKPSAQGTPNLSGPKVNTDAEKKPQNEDKAAPGDIFATQKPLAQGNSYLFEVIQKPLAQGTPNLLGPKVNTDIEKKHQNKDKAAPGDIFATQKPLALLGVIQKPPAQSTPNLLGPKVNTDAEKKPQNEDKAAPGDIFATQKPFAFFGVIQKPPAQGTLNLLGPKLNTDAEKKPQNEDKAAPGDIFATQKPLAQGNSYLFGAIQKPPAQGTPNLLGPKVNTDTEKKTEVLKTSTEHKTAPESILSIQNPPVQSSNLFGSFTLPKNNSTVVEPPQANDNKQTQPTSGKISWGTMNPREGSTTIFTKVTPQLQNSNPPIFGLFSSVPLKTNNETPNKFESISSAASENKPATTAGGIFENIFKTRLPGESNLFGAVTPKPNSSASGFQGLQTLFSSFGLTQAQPINPIAAPPIVVGSQFTLGSGLTKPSNQLISQEDPLINASAPVKDKKNSLRLHSSV